MDDVTDAERYVYDQLRNLVEETSRKYDLDIYKVERMIEYIVGWVIDDIEGV
jgi:hypothetical protein